MPYSDKSKNAKVTIHPCCNALLTGSKKWTQRDRHVHKIQNDGVDEWRRESGHYQQSKVEKHRYKTTVGMGLRARTKEGRVEAKIGCKILNRFLTLGKSQSKRVA